MRLHLAAFAAFSVMTLLAASQPAHAQQKKLENSEAQALQETQAMLGDQKQMQEWAKTHPDAKQSMNNVSTLTGGNEADSAAVYKLASDIFANMTKETGGDAGGMEKILAEAMKNPQAFASKLTPEQRQQLQNLSKSIESRSPKASPH